MDEIKNTEITKEKQQPTSELFPTTAFEHTLPGFLELAEDLKQTERAINYDYGISAKAINREELEASVGEKLEIINSSREIPIAIGEISTDYLIRMSRPNWRDHFPKTNSEQDVNGWEVFKAKFGGTIPINLEALRIQDNKINQLINNPRLSIEFAHYSSEQREINMTVATWNIAERNMEKLGDEIFDIYKNVAQRRYGSVPTSAEASKISSLQKKIAELKQERGKLIDDSEKPEQVKELLCKVQVLKQKYELEKGLLVDNQMQSVINESMPSICRGEPVIFIGETGGAKTQLAEHIANTCLGVEPEFVSGYSETNSYQLMGKDKLSVDKQSGATISDFMVGPVVRAMERGVPLILDEINAMSPGLLKRLNKIVQLRPGDSFTIQEDSGREILIQPGFCIIATANEKSKRYKDIDNLSVEFQNRFSANIYRIRYPDSNASFSDEPIENYILAQAAVVDRNGDIPSILDPNDFYNFVKAARVSQQIFTGEHGEGYRDFIDANERLVDGKPGLEETVIAPRTMIDILHKVTGSYGRISLDMALRTFVSGISNSGDRKVITTILKGYGFLKSTE